MNLFPIEGKANRGKSAIEKNLGEKEAILSGMLEERNDERGGFDIKERKRIKRLNWWKLPRSLEKLRLRERKGRGIARRIKLGE